VQKCFRNKKKEAHQQKKSLNNYNYKNKKKCFARRQEATRTNEKQFGGNYKKLLKISVHISKL
jgi:hypothetical protein